MPKQTCSFPKCKKKPFGDGDVCTDHLPKPAKVDAPVYSWKAGLFGEETEPNAAFFELCKSNKKPERYYNRITALVSTGPGKGGNAELVHNISCQHDTQPSNNVTVWYSWQGNDMTVWGLGKHSGGSGAGNNSYTMTWCDNKSKSWTREK